MPTRGISAGCCCCAAPWAIRARRRWLPELRSDAAHAHLAASDCGLIGPGLGRSGELTALLSYLVEKSDQPLVLDADGLNAFAGHIDVLRRAVCPVILTPHAAGSLGNEVARMGEYMADEYAAPSSS